MIAGQEEFFVYFLVCLPAHPMIYSVPREKLGVAFLVSPRKKRIMKISHVNFHKSIRHSKSTKISYIYCNVPVN